MTKQDALGLLAASRNDAVLAAWAAICLEFGVPAQHDVSPYDAWDAYQELFTLGAISPAVFDSIDIKQEFFSGRRLSVDAVQSVLDSFHNDSQPQDIPMNIKPGSPFGKKTALTPRKERQLPTRQAAIPLGGRQASGSTALSQSLSPRTSLAPTSGPAPSLAPTMSRNSLGAPTQPRPDLSSQDIHAITPKMYCSCGAELVLKNSGGQVLDDDDFPNGNLQLIDAMFAADCPECDLVWHCSVGRKIPHGSFR